MLNRVLDLVVDSPCSFEVRSLKVPPRDEEMTTAGALLSHRMSLSFQLSIVLQLWGESSDILDQVVADIQALVEANNTIADCSLELVSSVDEPLKEPILV